MSGDVCSYIFLGPDMGISIVLSVFSFMFCLFSYFAATQFILGIHGKKSPCYECHVEVHGAGKKTHVQHLVFSIGMKCKLSIYCSALKNVNFRNQDKNHGICCIVFILLLSIKIIYVTLLKYVICIFLYCYRDHSR